MKLLSQIQRGRTPAPRRTLVYGVHGVGKSTFGSMAEKPVFIQTEDGLGNIECERLPLASQYADVVAALSELYTEQHEYRTVVVDSLDWLERLIWADICKKRGIESIEDVGYGKGYVFALTNWREVLAGLDALRNDRGMGVILIAHAQIERFANPETDTYDRYRKIVVALLATMRAEPMRGALAVRVKVHPPDTRRRDLDNLQKSLLDALEHGGAFSDDSQIAKLEVERANVVPSGKVIVEIEERT